MLNELRYDLMITTTDYDAKLAELINEAVNELIYSVGVPVEGVSVSVSWSNQGVPTVTDNSTITDSNLIAAIRAYVRANFPLNENRERDTAAYDEKRSQLLTATGYGLPDDEGEDDDE